MLHNLMPLPGWVIFLSIFFPLTTSAFQIIYGKECDEFTSQVEVQGWYDDARTLSKTAAAAWIINAVDADPLLVSSSIHSVAPRFYRSIFYGFASIKKK